MCPQMGNSCNTWENKLKWVSCTSHNWSQYNWLVCLWFHISKVEIEDAHVNENLRWSCEKQKYMQTIIQSYNVNIINTKTNIIKALTLHETRQNKCWCKIAPNIQEVLMGVMRKGMFYYWPINHDTQGSGHYNSVWRLCEHVTYKF